MRRRFTIYSAFLDINNSIEFLISRNHSRNVFWCAVLLFIKYFLISRISWYQEFHFLISRNKIRFLDIKNSISWMNSWYQKNQILDIKKYLMNSKTAHQNTFLEWFLDIKNSIFWYQEMCIIFLYQEIEFFISRNAFLDTRKCISWYQEIYFLISRNGILDIKKCWINSKTAPHILITCNEKWMGAKITRYFNSFAATFLRKLFSQCHIYFNHKGYTAICSSQLP